MSNLTNVYAYLRNNYADLDVQFGKPVSYIRTLSGIKNQKIIFIFKEDRSKLPVAFSSPITDTEKSSDVHFNITGSPLRDDNSISNLINTSIANKMFLSKPWEDSEEVYTPIGIDLAREILSNIVNHQFPKGSHGWIFILCHDPAAPQVATFLLSLYKGEKNHFTRGITKYHGVIRNEEKSMENLLQRHGSMGKAEINIESMFEINEDLSLRFLNKLSDEAPSLAHINDSSDITMYQRIEIGKSHVLCENLWSEIKLLWHIKSDIINVKNNSCDGSLFEPNFNYGMRSFEAMQESVNRILMDVEIAAESANDENATDSHLEAVMKRVAARPHSDMTDQLWQVLKNASSYTDLKKILTFVFQISSRSCIVNIPMNENRLSELIRELSNQRLAVPHLTSTEPLELLLEIGLEKVLKDYEFILAESKICNLKDIAVGECRSEAKGDDVNVATTIRKSLAPSAELAQASRKTLLHDRASQDGLNDDDCGFYNSRFNEKEVETCISKLAQIHLAIEHILMIQNNLNLEHDYSAIAKKLLQSPLLTFENLLAKKHDRLDVPVMDRKVIGLVDNLVPNSQKIKMRSENVFKAIESTFYFNIEQIVPTLAEKEKEDEIVDKKGDTFHFISYTSVISKF